MTLIQRFESALNLNPQLQLLVLDWAYMFPGSRAVFHRAQRSQRDDIVRLLRCLAGCIGRLLEPRGLLIAYLECPGLSSTDDPGLGHIQAASFQYRIAAGPNAGRKAITL